MNYDNLVEMCKFARTTLQSWDLQIGDEVANVQTLERGVIQEIKEIQSLVKKVKVNDQWSLEFIEPRIHFIWLPSEEQLRQIGAFDTASYDSFLDEPYYPPPRNPVPPKWIFASERERLLAFLEKSGYQKYWIPFMWLPSDFFQ